MGVGRTLKQAQASETPDLCPDFEEKKTNMVMDWPLHSGRLHRSGTATNLFRAIKYAHNNGSFTDTHHFDHIVIALSLRQDAHRMHRRPLRGLCLLSMRPSGGAAAVGGSLNFLTLLIPANQEGLRPVTASRSWVKTSLTGQQGLIQGQVVRPPPLRVKGGWRGHPPPNRAWPK